MKLPNESIERVITTLSSAQLGDPRRNVRLERFARKLAADPQASLPKAMASEADLEGGYRLLNSSHIEAEDINESHFRHTAKQARNVGKVVAIHDTTKIKCQYADAEEVGYLNTGKPGFFFHYTLVTAQGSRKPLGVIHTEVLSRKERPKRRKKPKRRLSGKETSRNPNRESLRWWRSIDQTAQALNGVDVVHVTDREGDGYELFSRCIERGYSFIIRGRAVVRDVIVDGLKESLPSITKSLEGIITREVFITTRKPKTAPRNAKSHPPRNARIAKLKFAATELELIRPKHLPKHLPEKLKLNLVDVSELDCPLEEEPVQWLLFTTEVIDSVENIENIVDTYRSRWLIEDCNKAIKTGCKYEQRQLENQQALLNLLAIILPIACELLWLRATAREQPNQKASNILTPTQLKILTALGPRKLGPNPTAKEALWALAGLGGHLKRNGEPGWLVLYRGLETLKQYEIGYTLAAQARLEQRDL